MRVVPAPTTSVVAAITIGQTPRPDLLAPLRERVREGMTIIEVGALDELTADDIASRPPRPSASANRYPLTTRLRDGSVVTLDEDDLAPLVQHAVDRAQHAGADVTLLLCAGGFSDVTAPGPLVRPFDAAVATAQRIGARSVVVAVPYEGQTSSAHRKWVAAGFDVRMIVGDIAALDLPVDPVVDAIILDYVGHAARDVRALRARSSVAVIDLGECGAETAVASLATRGNEREAEVR